MSNTKQSRVVETLNGPVQGKTYTFEEDHEATAFLGIPYAKPPIGELRFKKPVPADKWTELKQCTEFSASFPYVPFGTDANLKLSEDALYLNVFVPEAKQGGKPLTNLPVFFYLHGGGFTVKGADCSGDEGICRYLCSKGVIVVTPNYRLGIFGFLTLENEEVKGNYGLWDMALALKWTKDNISAFGGDSSKITVGGQSAGGVAADLLTLSPHTRDLFNQAILLAGTSQTEYLYMGSDLSRKVSIEYAKHLGAKIDGKTEEEINQQAYNFFKTCDASKLALGMGASPNFKFYPEFYMPYGPCLDGDFLPKSLEELRKEAPRKLIINGLTEHEGLLSMILSGNNSYDEIAYNSLRSLRPNVPSELLQKLCNEVIGTSDDPKSHEHILRCVNVISDIMLNTGALELAETRTELGDKVYNFMFFYYRKGSLGPMSALLPFEAATHCMELPYLFGRSFFGEFEIKEEDKEIIERFTTHLTNFIKTGCPNDSKYEEKWDEFKLGQGDPYFLFGQNEYGMRKGFAGGDRSRFWIKFFKEYPRKCHV